MKTKIILTLIFMLIVATLLAGCGNGQPAEAPHNGTSAAVKEEIIRPSENSAEVHESGSESATKNVTSTFVEDSEVNDASVADETQQEAETTEEHTSENPQTEESEPATKIKDREPQINFSDLE